MEVLVIDTSLSGILTTIATTTPLIVITVIIPLLMIIGMIDITTSHLSTIDPCSLGVTTTAITQPIHTIGHRILAVTIPAIRATGKKAIVIFLKVGAIRRNGN